jgi:glycosyltransferase involved in cell wall biosynthesis
MLPYLLVVFIAVCCVQLFYYLGIFSFFAFQKNRSPNTPTKPPVSVIICAKNEAKHLTENVPFFIDQEYPVFELVLINDGSTDKTLRIIEKFKENFPKKIKVVNVAPNEQFWGSKKYALTLGIKAASYEHLLLTDADCKPVSNHWILEMSSGFNEQKQLILGYGAYKKINNSFLNKIIRFETLQTAIQYFSFAKIGMPYMGVGRNLAYTKTQFFKANGFVNHMRIKSGDDDLFVNQIATKSNTACCISANSFTESTPKLTFKNWIQQKRRHISTASHYKKIHQFLLGLFYVSQFLFWLLAAVLLIFLYNWEIVAALILVRFTFFYIIIGYSAKKLNEKQLVLIAPFFEIFLIFTQMFIFIKNLSSKPTNW